MKVVGNLRAMLSTTLYLRGRIWRDRLSPPRVGYRTSDRQVNTPQVRYYIERQSNASAEIQSLIYNSVRSL